MQIISREEAQALGKKRFYTGVACKNGHDCERFVSNGGCCDCINWKTPHKRTDKKNMAFPEKGFIFTDVCSRDEMRAALRYVQHMRWHEAALHALRSDPQLMAQFCVVLPSEDEKSAAREVLERGAPPTRTGGLNTPAQIAARNERLRKLQEKSE